MPYIPAIDGLDEQQPHVRVARVAAEFARFKPHRTGMGHHENAVKENEEERR